MAKNNKRKKIKPRSALFPEPIAKEIPLNDHITELFDYSLQKSHILDSRLFPQMEKISEYEWASKTVEYARMAEISEEMIFAVVKTGRFITEQNIQHLNDEEIQEWDDAIKEYEKSKNENLMEDTLKDLSKDTECPILTKNQLKILFDSRVFHHLLIEKCEKTFVNDHMKETVINGIMIVLNELKEITGRVDLDTSTLVDNVFSPDNPILITSSYELGDKTEQQGVHFIFKGFVLAIRNQFLHRDIYLENPYITLDYLSFINFLLIILDNLKLKNSSISEE